MVNNNKKVCEFTLMVRKVKKAGYTLYKTNDSRGQYCITENHRNCETKISIPQFFNSLTEIGENWFRGGY